MGRRGCWRGWRWAGVAGTVVLAATGCLHEIAPVGPNPFATDSRISVNASGMIAGMTGADGSGRGGHVFVKRPDEPLELIDGGATESTSAGINDAGVVVGTLGVTRTGTPPSSGHPFRWSSAAGLQDLGLPPGAVGARAVGVNAAGTVLVNGQPGFEVESPTRVFLYDPASASWTALPGAGQRDVAAALNDDGLVVGWTVPGPGSPPHAVWWDASPAHTPHEFDDGDVSASWAQGVNDVGMVVGRTSDANGSKAVLWSAVGQAPRVLAIDVTPVAVNNEGVIAGSRRAPTDTGSSRSTAIVLDTVTGAVIDLGDYDSGFSIATDINDAGLAVGLAQQGGQPGQVVSWDPYTRPA